MLVLVKIPARLLDRWAMQCELTSGQRWGMHAKLPSGLSVKSADFYEAKRRSHLQQVSDNSHCRRHSWWMLEQRLTVHSPSKSVQWQDTAE